MNGIFAQIVLYSYFNDMSAPEDIVYIQYS